MKAIIYTGPSREITVPKARANFVRNGDPVDVPNDIADKLVAQCPDHWKMAESKTKATTKPAAKPIESKD